MNVSMDFPLNCQFMQFFVISQFSVCTSLRPHYCTSLSVEYKKKKKIVDENSSRIWRNYLNGLNLNLNTEEKKIQIFCVTVTYRLVVIEWIEGYWHDFWRPLDVLPFCLGHLLRSNVYCLLGTIVWIHPNFQLPLPEKWTKYFSYQKRSQSKREKTKKSANARAEKIIGLFTFNVIVALHIESKIRVHT